MIFILLLFDSPPEMLVAFKVVVKADHFGAAAEPGSFKYLREQVYFGVPAFYPVVGLNMLKCFLFFLFFFPPSPLQDRNTCSSFSGIQSSCADLRLTFHSVLNRSAQADGVLCGQPVAAVIVYLTLKICTHLKGRAGNVFASSFIFLRFFCCPNLTLQFQTSCWH